MRFSIIIPVYNTEKYIKKCLESVQNQTCKDYEVIIINDGSTDNSENIIKEWAEKNTQIEKCIKTYKNTGLSEARNRGVKLSKGEYIFFLDSDDYIDSNLLEVVNNFIEYEKNVDLYRIPKRIIDENSNVISEDKVKTFSKKSGEEGFIRIRNNRIILETAWTYFIKRKYWVDNKFSFAYGRQHEDWGLMPLVIIKANSVSAISKPYYNYVVRKGSIITRNDYTSEVRKAFDTLEQYDFLVEEVNKIDIKNKKAKKMYLSYVTDGVIGKLKKLHGNEHEQYLKELKKKNVLKNAKVYSIKSFIKRMLYIIFLKK